ncbi:unnamed protein product [Ranitomeya imitator]|uniref:Uncharacterized protein n=1 Tax=Ranitomeya imitator TaxID=111125 RepID=A0ABN9KXT6_9NEOB|nr:unnamed protein product [Ranitomeya imitator]
MTEVGHILRWAEENRSMISAVHIPGVENWEADFLSRQVLDSGEWSLYPEIFHQICCRWGTLDVDLMPSRLNSKVLNFIARSHDPAAIEVDALVHSWHRFQLPYIFPPLPLLQRVIKKIRAEGIPVILIAPDWPRRAWYAELVADVPSCRPVVPGPHLPPELRGPVFDDMAVESWVLTQAGFSQKVISTMISARKPTSMRIYHRIWKTFFAWCKDRGCSPLEFFIPSILEFLQSGLDLGLALSSLKGQISALSVLFHLRIANRIQVKKFIQGVSHVVPPYKMPFEPWDLNLVLGGLQEAPFEPLQDISLFFLSWKVAFLVAVTSIRRVSELAALSCQVPFLIFHQDKVVLRTSPSFLPKVVSSFHLNEDIVLPSLCPAPVHRIEKALHTLDLVRALTRYVSRMASFRRSDALFVLPDGPRKGLAASKATIAKWIRSAIQESYRVRGHTVPAGIKAHSTRSVGASSAIRHQASAAQVCRAATWSSLHTFTKHYHVHSQASAEGKYHKQIKIVENATGYSYENLFKPYVDETLTEVWVEDPYIRHMHQFYNFLRFCEMLIKGPSKVKKISLLTSRDESTSFTAAEAEQEQRGHGWVARRHRNGMRTSDNDILVSLVHMRVPLWDTRVPQHLVNVTIRRLWNEVAKAMWDGWDNAPTLVRNAFLLKVKPRWRSMKDCFNKDLHQESRVPRALKPPKVFSNYPEFKAILKKQLSQPEKKNFFANRKYLEARYPFPQKDTKEWTDPPEVDPPVSRLAAQSLLSLPDSSTLRDAADRQVERMARSIFEAAGASLAPAFASVWAAKAIVAWAKIFKLASKHPLLSDQAVQIAVVADYMLHAALDSARDVARIVSNAITIRCILWLREWKADAASKKSLTHLPYLSGRLFGEQLDMMISNATGGKSTSLPQLKPKRTYKKRNQTRFRSFRNFSGWSVSRPAQNRNRSPRMDNSRSTQRSDKTWQSKAGQSKPRGGKSQTFSSS